MGSVFIIGSALKIVTTLGIGIVTSSMLTIFHNYEFKTNKKKGDRDESNGSVLREKARSLS